MMAAARSGTTRRTPAVTIISARLPRREGGGLLSHEVIRSGTATSHDRAGRNRGGAARLRR